MWRGLVMSASLEFANRFVFLYLASITTILGYIGWYWALAKGGIARIATVQFFQPVSGLVLAALLLGERMTLPLLAASIVILVGVWIARRR